MAGRSPLIDLLVVFVGVYLLQVAAGLLDVMDGLFVLTAPLSENPWTIVTSVYAHAGPAHLLSNTVALVLFGLPVAVATTRLRFHLFFLGTGAVAGVSHVVMSHLFSPVPGIEAAGVLGASGAVFALLGYLLASNPLSSGIGAAISLPPWATYLLFVGVAAVVTVATASPGVALIAHFTGLLCGLIAGRANLLRVPATHN